MSPQPLKPGWKMVKFGEVVKNANLVERDPETNGVERIVGLEHIDPENLHVRRWNAVADGTSSSASAGLINARSPMPSLKAFAPGIS
jgi:type I restriction enzyme S subunit